MCGIAGILKCNGLTPPEDVAAVQRMMDAQVHRGPDDSGLYRDRQVVLGHRRLSILGLSPAGQQPMSNEDGAVWITYNDEIYNYRVATKFFGDTGIIAGRPPVFSGGRRGARICRSSSVRSVGEAKRRVTMGVSPSAQGE